LYPARNRVSGSNICLQDVDSVIASSHSRQAKLVYLDPPYGREHYSRFYHVLEAIAVGKFTEDTSVTRMSNDRFQSDYGRRSRAAKAFEDVLSICSDNGTPVAISYVDESQGSAVANRIIPVDTVRSAVRSRYSKFTEIEVSTKNYSQLNRVDGKDRRKGREILIVGHS
jgi:adenine-specific DNA methylase